ncbi:hypothetical protein HAX54_021508 [Datura stramonium]|uniref:Uncharacterized protein n=1 Tax=Datura stramonium TaxID=4076 RepID=A0ABS8Y468_DATST|nr:hypothetical protein [Datura stramonium]
MGRRYQYPSKKALMAKEAVSKGNMRGQKGKQSEKVAQLASVHELVGGSPSSRRAEGSVNSHKNIGVESLELPGELLVEDLIEDTEVGATAKAQISVKERNLFQILNNPTLEVHAKSLNEGGKEGPVLGYG